MKDYEVINSEKVFSGKIIDVFRDTIKLPNGKSTVREVVSHVGAAAVIPIDDDGNIVFVRQYRHPVKKHVLEIPAGTLEDGEEPLTCAIRELEEETSFKSDKFTFITKMCTSIGFCNEIISIYLAENLKEGSFNLDEDEFVEIEKYSLKESIEKIFNGEIIDSKTMVAILAYRQMLNKG